MVFVSQEKRLKQSVGVGVAIGMSATSLLMTTWLVIQSLDDADDERRVDDRLACLELPGPNDCGLDGR